MAWMVTVRAPPPLESEFVLFVELAPIGWPEAGVLPNATLVA